MDGDLSAKVAKRVTMNQSWDSDRDARPNRAAFHQRARQVLPDDFFWDCADEFAPVGDDNGADVLNAYRDWRFAHSPEDCESFLKNLLRRWELPENWADESTREIPKDLSRADEYPYRTGDKALIAFAFSQIMVDGKLDARARDSALRAIDRQKILVTIDARKYPNAPVPYEEQVQ